jgi:eukaryotic-like serine/threonine-protein kinase
MSVSTPEIPSSLDTELEDGSVVGEYVIDGKLGQGAFGTVYKGVHPLIGKVVAIKVLARRYSVDPEMVSRFIAEARAVNQIRNRHIIDIFSFGSLDDERQYYVMEYLDGEPLDALLERVGNLSIRDALPILRAIAKALDAAHAKGIAHRDLKAENVFLGVDSEGALFPKLLDFGIAKLLVPEVEQGASHKTRTGISIGTPYYMSPEQCRGRDVDQRTDLYAFGVLMYRMLTGQFPFDADDHMAILMKHFSEDPPPPSTHLPDLPPSIDDVVLWLLAKDPAERPADLRTAVHALERAAVEAGFDIGNTSGWDIQSTPGGTAFQTQPPRRRTSHVQATPATTTAVPVKRSRVPLVLAFAIVGVLGAAGAVWALRDNSTAPAAPTVATPAAPPAPAPAPVATPAPTPPAETRTSVIVTISGVPDGTEVLVAGSPIGVAPGPVQLAYGTDPVVLTFRADGYVPASKPVTPNADSSLAVALKKKAVRRAKSKGDKDDIIDVDFGKNL